MNEELKPCPFCMADDVSEHQPDCYFTLRDKGAMRSELAKAWNRRTPTVPDASAAAAAPGASELPPLPKCVAYGVMGLTGLDPNDGHRQLIGVSAGKPGTWCKSTTVELHTADQMREYAQLALAGQCGARQEPVAWLRFWAAQYSTEDGNIGTDEGLKVCEPHEFGMDGRPAFPVYASPVSAQGAPKSDAKRMESDGGQPEHETIVLEGDKLVCTACGTSASAQPASGSDVGVGGQS